MEGFSAIFQKMYRFRGPSRYSDNNCEKHVSSVIQWWNKSSKFPQDHGMTKKFQDKLDSLLDIAEKQNGRYSAENGIEYLQEQYAATRKEWDQFCT